MARRNETIRSGGFQGGQHVQAAQPTQGNTLLELADSLNVINRQGSAMVGNAVENNLKQLEVDGEPSGAQLIAQNTGLDTAGWDAQLSDPNVAEVLKNPYAAAIVHKHRGRLSSDELALGLVQSGVDLGDKAAVDAYYKEHSPSFEGASKFFTAGFNEQNARHQSQFFQQTIAKNAADIATTTRDAATTAFMDILKSGPITQESSSAAFAALTDPAFSNLGATERTQMQADAAQMLMSQGRVEELKVFLATPRGDAPALQDSAGIVDDAPAWIAQAARIAEGDAAARDATLKLGLYKMIDNESKALPMFETIEESADYQALSEQGRLAAYGHYQSAKDSRRARADAAATRNLADAIKTQNALTSASLLRNGQGFAVDNGDAQEAFDLIRAGMFEGRTWDQMEPQDAEQLKKYGVMMGNSSHFDDTLSRFLMGAGAYATAETLKGNERNLGQIFGVFQMLDPNSARRAVKDDKTLAMLDEMDHIARGFPNRPVEQIATEAIARMNRQGDSFKINSKDLRVAVDKTAVTVKERWLWDDKITMDENVIYPYLRERAYEVWLINGNNTEAALRTATNDAKTKAFAPVNGKPVRVPQGEGWSPERFTAGAEEYLRAVDPTGYADWSLTPLTMGAYRITPPEGYEGDAERIVFEKQISDAAGLRGARENAEKSAKDAAALAERDARNRLKAERRLNPKHAPLGALSINP